MDYEAIHNKNLNVYSRKVRQDYLDVINQILKLSAPLSLNPNGEFYWRNYPEILDSVNRLILDLNSNVYATTVEGINLDWETAVEKNNAVAQAIYGKQLADLPKDIRQNYLSNNGEARRAFIQRKIDGLKLSDRVWRNTRQLKWDLELALEIGIGDGKSATRLATDVKQYLNNPDKLFRRVRNKENGELRLSKAYKSYSPGQGVYKSSYKNALRLTRNEMNFSYRTSEYEKRQKQDFIVAIRVNTVAGWTPEVDKGGIMCDQLAGLYPPNYNFQGNHVNCRCFTTNVLKSDAELEKDLDIMLGGGEPIKKEDSTNYVGGYQPFYKKYVKDNQKKWANWKNPPLFIQNEIN